MSRISIDLQTAKPKKKEVNIIGIDLGTSNSLVAYTTDGESKIIKDKDNQSNLVESIIHFDENNNIIIGEDARKLSINNSNRTIYSVKRLLGKSYEDLAHYTSNLAYNIIDADGADSLVKVEIDKKYYSPIELSSYLLKRLKESAEAQLNTTIDKAVITVPAYFNDSQRQATRDAGKLAGLDVLRIINEPTAASLAYGIGMDKDIEEKVVVYDLGGGTFDISILHIEDGIFEVLSTNGDSFLGGDDFDNLIVKKWLEDYPSLRDKKEEQLLFHLKYLAVAAKKELSEKENFEVKFEGLTLKLNIEEFNTMIRPLVEKTIDHCKSALTDAKLSKEEIDKIVMVGGSTRVNLVKSEIAKFFEKPVFNDLNSDEIVAIGAAIQADILAGNNKDFLLLDISPLSLGIETVGGLMDVIIPRNTKIPARFARNYTTSVDGQTNLKVAIYQGERDLIVDNRKLGEFVLRKIPPMAAGLPKLEIQFILDVDGILTVKASELRSGVESQVEIKSAYGISEEEMGKMLLDSIKNAKSDIAAKAILEAINEGTHVINSTYKFIDQNISILKESEIENLKEHVSILEKSVEKKDKDAINSSMEELNNYSMPLAHRALDASVVGALKGKEIE